MRHHIALARNLLLATAVSAWNLAAEPTQAYSHGDPTPVEQYMLELINRARMNPTAEGVFLDTLDTAYSRSTRADKPEFFTTIRQEFASYPVAQPLAFHPSLTQAARNHAADMVSRNYFAHVTPEGLAPWDRTKAAGYPSQLVGENIDGLGMTTAADALRSHYNLMVDAYNLSHATHPLGHRLNVLDTDFSEIGIGSAGNAVSGKVVQNFGDNGQIFLLGVVFKDVNGNTVLPIWVGVYEANAIALEIEKVATPRPMTHDLIKNLLMGLNTSVKKVVVSDLREETYFALIWMEQDGETISVDSRPSDALALALRLDCPIYVEEQVLKTSKVTTTTAEKVTNEELKKWLEGLNDEDLGRYKM